MYFLFKFCLICQDSDFLQMSLAIISLKYKDEEFMGSLK